ncbi:heterokaryon incompatibility protein-domain-containing protein [Whalleya microplaca]|nr:heterokaryon incompatibility protein-domain-containing protein [Whalleya microplaca]
MWLINTETLEREYVESPKPKSYAILSHTWESDGSEVSFAQFGDLRTAKALPGFTKIQRTTVIARERGLAHAWVDTVCIDKSSSAELSEAINSMYRWYSLAAVCLAYLSDLPSAARVANFYPEAGADDVRRLQGTYFKMCRWFTRGWTLQELLAPAELEFYDSGWSLYGDKRALVAEVADLTHIRPDVLRGETRPQGVSVACRMSWAAGRETRRPEDRAYCLLGLFDIHMALLYGEGERAFVRLQEEICRQSTDLSLFAWKAVQKKPAASLVAQEFRGILASSPAEFRHCGSFTAFQGGQAQYQGEFAITNRGLRLDQMPLYQNPDGGILMCLDCIDQDASTQGPLALRLTKVANTYVRSHAHDLFDLTCSIRLGGGGGVFDESRRAPYADRIYISRVLTPEDSALLQKRSLRVRVREDAMAEKDVGFDIVAVTPREWWDPLQKLFFLDQRDFVCAFYVEVKGSAWQNVYTEKFVLVCGIGDVVAGCGLSGHCGEMTFDGFSVSGRRGDVNSHSPVPGPLDSHSQSQPHPTKTNCHRLATLVRGDRLTRLEGQLELRLLLEKMSASAGAGGGVGFGTTSAMMAGFLQNTPATVRGRHFIGYLDGELDPDSDGLGYSLEIRFELGHTGVRGRESTSRLRSFTSRDTVLSTETGYSFSS